MQRWIIAGVIVVFLLLGGGYFGLRTVRQNRPHPVWVPVPIRTDLPIAKRDELIKELKARLSEPAVLEQVSKDLGLADHFDFASDKEAAADLNKRLIVRAGEMPQGRVPAIHVGFSGKAKDARLTEKTVMRLMKDAWPILGVKAPEEPGSNTP